VEILSLQNFLLHLLKDEATILAYEDWDSPVSLLKKTTKIAGIIILILLVTSVLFVLITPFFGWRTEIVLSGSMEPAIPTGGVVVSRPIAAEDVRAGDVIMFASIAGHSLTTHRVVKVEPKTDGLYFITKGDANKGADINEMNSSQIVGTIVFSIPYLGYLIAFIRTPFGLVLFLIVPVAVLVISELLNVLKSED
jgi:signal peptidase